MKKRKTIPSGYPSNCKESEINLTPTEIHQRKKKGLTPVNNIPARIGFSMRDGLSVAVRLSFLLRVLTTWKIPNTIRLTPPMILITLIMLNMVLEEVSTINGKEKRIITGSSTIVCPIANFIPDQNPPYLLKAKFAKKSGPGVRTPDADTSMICSPISSNIIIKPVFHQ